MLTETKTKIHTADKIIDAPKITVLLPVRNARRFLQKTLDSVLSQSYKNFELVVVDDGSDDCTGDILRKAVSVDIRVKVFSFEFNQGIINALNHGIDQAKTPFIARMDADDIMHPDRLKMQYEHFLQNPDLDVVGCLVEKFSSKGVQSGYRLYIEWLNSLCDHDSIVRDIFVESPLAHPSVMMRTEVIRQAGGYKDYGWAEDYDLWLRLYLAGKKFGKVKQVLLSWRDEADRLSRSDCRYSLDNFYRCKAHYMSEGILKNRPVIIWGAKRRSRSFAKYLGSEIKAFVDVDHKKVGNKVNGIPVIYPQNLENYPKTPVLSYVSSQGARLNIRPWLISNNYVEGKDFFMMA